MSNEIPVGTSYCFNMGISGLCNPEDCPNYMTEECELEED